MPTTRYGARETATSDPVWQPSKRAARAALTTKGWTNGDIVSQVVGDIVVESGLPDEAGSVVTGLFDGERVTLALVQGAFEEANYWMALTGNSASATIEESEITSVTVLIDGDSIPGISSAFPTTITTESDLSLNWPNGTVLADRDGDKVERFNGEWYRTRVQGSPMGIRDSSRGESIIYNYLPCKVVHVGSGVNQDRPADTKRMDWESNAAGNY